MDNFARHFTAVSELKNPSQIPRKIKIYFIYLQTTFKYQAMDMCIAQTNLISSSLSQCLLNILI